PSPPEKTEPTGPGSVPPQWMRGTALYPQARMLSPGVPALSAPILHVSNAGVIVRTGRRGEALGGLGVPGADAWRTNAAEPAFRLQLASSWRLRPQGERGGVGVTLSRFVAFLVTLVAFAWIVQAGAASPGNVGSGCVAHHPNYIEGTF